MNDFTRFLVLRPSGVRPSAGGMEAAAARDEDTPVPAFITVQTFATYTGVTGIIGILVSFINVGYQRLVEKSIGAGGMFLLTFGAALLVNAFGLLVAYSDKDVKKPTGGQWLTTVFLALLNTFQMTLAVIGGTAVLAGEATGGSAGK
jgi:predicted phage tail protein